MEFDYSKDGKEHFKLWVSKFYLFKAILRIAWQNIGKPALALLIFLFAFYWLIKERGNARSLS